MKRQPSRQSHSARVRRIVTLVLIVGIVSLNAVAWMQAWATTHYADGGERTLRPEEMALTDKVGAVLTGVSVPRPVNAHSPKDVSLEYTTHMIEVGTGEQLEAWHIPAQAPRGTVLMFNGYAESKSGLLAAAAVLHKQGYSTLLVDFRGAGGSSGSDTTLGVREAKDVAAAAAYVEKSWPDGPVILHGVSMGAVAVLRAVALEGVEPEAVILESPFDRLLSTVRNRFDAIGLPAFPAAELLVFWGSVQHGFDGFAHNSTVYAESAACPALLMHGDLDPRVTPEQAQVIYDRLSGPKQFVSFPDAGHESLAAADPERWQVEVGSFLQTVEQQK